MTVPSSRPDTPAQQHADTVRAWIADYTECDCDEDSTCLIHRTAPHLDALLKEVERLTAERDEALASNAVFMSGEAYSRMHDAWHNETERAEAAERERDNAKDALERMRQELVRVDGLNRAAEALAERREAERDDLLHAFQEIWDDWCSGHMGDCTCIVCSLTADALNIDRDDIAEGKA